MDGETTLAAAVAEGRAGGFLGAPCSVAHREFSGISHIRFSMGVSAKLAALHTVERDLMRQPHGCSRRCCRSGAHLKAFNFANSYIGGAVTRASKIDAARSSQGHRPRLSRVGALAADELGRLRRSCGLADRFLFSLVLLTIFQGESLANSPAAGEGSPRS